MKMPTLLLAALLSVAHAQQPAPPNAQEADSSSLRFALTHGKVQGQFRYYAMATDNAPGLSDYFANVAGLSMRYETAPFHGLRFAAGGSTHFSLLSSDLSARDPLTQQPNRYELGLLDIDQPGRKGDFSRLEVLSLTYAYKRHSLRIGRQDAQGPLVNPQDGRMRPTFVEGAWLHAEPGKHLQLDLAWIYGISPRSTTRWYGIGESIGIYSAGVQASGQPSAYKGHLDSRTLLSGTLGYQPSKRLQVQLHDLFAAEVFNTALLQAEYVQPLPKDLGLQVGVMALRQDAVADGGNADPARTYFRPGGKSHILSSRLGLKGRTWETSLNYTRITADGRFLMPREWGRESFYTFLTRERTEGASDVHAFAVKVERNWKRLRSRAALGAGYVEMPDVLDFARNKYGLPSYTQVNLDLRHTFQGHLQGLVAQSLIVAKIGLGDLHGNRRYEFNRVNMVNYSLVLNYNF